MRLELKDQRDIILSLKAQGGYGKKWASAFQVGNPDLICALPGVGGFLMEVKSINLLEQEYIVDVDVSPKLKHESKQRYELQQWSQAGITTCIGIVLHSFKNKRDKSLLIVPWWTKRIGNESYRITSWDGNCFDILNIMQLFLKGAKNEPRKAI